MCDFHHASPRWQFPTLNSSRPLARVAIGVLSRALRGTLYYPAGTNVSPSRAHFCTSLRDKAGSSALVCRTLHRLAGQVIIAVRIWPGRRAAKTVWSKDETSRTLDFALTNSARRTPRVWRSSARRFQTSRGCLHCGATIFASANTHRNIHRFVTSHTAAVIRKKSHGLHAPSRSLP